MTPVRSANPRRAPVVAARCRSEAAATAAGRRAGRRSGAPRRATPRATSRSPSTTTPIATASSGRGPAGKRIDDRQVAAPVRRREEHEVQRPRPRPDEERRCAQRLGGDRRPASTSQPTSDDRDQDDRTPRRRPTVAVRSGSPAVLSRMFQRGVQDRGERDERRRRPGPRPSLGRVGSRRCARARQPRATSRRLNAPRPEERARRPRRPRAGPHPRGQSQTPTIGWPRCVVRASWWTQSGSLSAGAMRSMRNVRITSSATTSAAKRGAEQAADGDPDAGQARSRTARARRVPSDRRSRRRSTGAAPTRCRCATMITAVMTTIAANRPRPPRERPAGARHRRRQERPRAGRRSRPTPTPSRASTPRTRRG